MIGIKNKTFKRILLTSAIALLIGTVFYVLLNMLMDAAVHTKKAVLVPDLNGKSLSEALSVASSANLGIKKEGEDFDQKFPAGTVLRQNPPAGMTVREGKFIKVTVSRGGAVIFVPDLLNQPVRSAEISLRLTTLTLGEVTSKFSLKVSKGKVISQDPALGSIAQKGALVNIVVSAGEPPKNIKLMPDFANKNIEDARRWAQEKNFNLVVLEEKAPNISAGTIIKQSLACDEQISDGAQITLTVSFSDNNPARLQGNKIFYYEISQGGQERFIRIVLLDSNGEKEIFSGSRAPGTKLEVPYDSTGQARLRVFMNGILVEEREEK